MVWYLIFIQKPLPQGQWVLPTCPLISYRKHSDGCTSHTCSSIKTTFVHLFPSPGFVFLSVWYLVLVVCLLPRVASGLWFPYCFIFSLLRAWNPGLCLGSQHWLTVMTGCLLVKHPPLCTCLVLYSPSGTPQSLCLGPWYQGLPVLWFMDDEHFGYCGHIEGTHPSFFSTQLPYPDHFMFSP